MKKLGLVAIILALVFGMGIFSNVSAAKGEIELAYVEWSCATASVNVVKAVLQEKLGYKVEIIPVSAAAMWQAVACGDVDGMTTAWLPVTHAHYMAKMKDKVVDLGSTVRARESAW